MVIYDQVKVLAEGLPCDLGDCRKTAVARCNWQQIWYSSYCDNRHNKKGYTGCGRLTCPDHRAIVTPEEAERFKTVF